MYIINSASPEQLAAACNSLDFRCTMGNLPCPFGGKNCDDITPADWQKISEKTNGKQAERLDGKA